MTKEEQIKEWIDYAKASDGINFIVVMKKDGVNYPFYCEEEDEIHEVKAAYHDHTYVQYIKVIR